MPSHSRAAARRDRLTPRFEDVKRMTVAIISGFSADFNELADKVDSPIHSLSRDYGMVGIPRGAWAFPITVVARSSPQEGLRIRTGCRILKQLLKKDGHEFWIAEATQPSP